MHTPMFIAILMLCSFLGFYLANISENDKCTEYTQDELKKKFCEDNGKANLTLSGIVCETAIKTVIGKCNHSTFGEPLNQINQTENRTESSIRFNSINEKIRYFKRVHAPIYRSVPSIISSVSSTLPTANDALVPGNTNTATPKPNDYQMIKWFKMGLKADSIKPVAAMAVKGHEIISNIVTENPKPNSLSGIWLRIVPKQRVDSVTRVMDPATGKATRVYKTGVLGLIIVEKWTLLGARK